MKIRVPVKVVEAMLDSGDGERLDIAAGLEALAAEGATLMTLEAEDHKVRIWVDGDMQGI